MKSIKQALVASCVVLLGAAGMDAAAQPVNKIWETSCASCHGNSGETEQAGGLAGRLDWLGTDDRAVFDAVLAHDGTGLPVLSDGRSGADLSAAEAWVLVNHLREFQDRARKADRAARSPGARGVFGGDRHDYRVETVIGDGLDTPWSVSWLDADRMMVADRGGTLRVIGSDGRSDVVGNTPGVWARGQGGLMDVAFHEPSRMVYLSYAHEIDGEAMTRIVRGRLTFSSSGRAGYQWSEEELVWEADEDDYLSGGLHFGCRLVFDGAEHLFFAIGERGRGEHAQDLRRPNGKVHRVRLDGTIPADNPFADVGEGVYGSIWSYGHRNPQGLAMDDDGVLWDTEHGPRGGDEVNVVERGGNYGWPLVSFGMNYSGQPLEAPWAEIVGVEEEIVMPAFRWLPSIAACGLDVVTDRGRGMMFSGWRGDLLAGGLAGQCVERLRFVDGVLVEREELVRGIGRVRDVAVGPEGAVYVVLNSPDKIVRLTEAE